MNNPSKAYILQAKWIIAFLQLILKCVGGEAPQVPYNPSKSEFNSLRKHSPAVDISSKSNRLSAKSLDRKNIHMNSTSEENRTQLQQSKNTRREKMRSRKSIEESRRLNREESTDESTDESTESKKESEKNSAEEKPFTIYSIFTKNIEYLAIDISDKNKIDIKKLHNIYENYKEQLKNSSDEHLKPIKYIEGCESLKSKNDPDQKGSIYRCIEEIKNNYNRGLNEEEKEKFIQHMKTIQKAGPSAIYALFGSGASIDLKLILKNTENIINRAKETVYFKKNSVKNVQLWILLKFLKIKIKIETELLKGTKEMSIDLQTMLKDRGVRFKKPLEETDTSDIVKEIEDLLSSNKIDKIEKDFSAEIYTSLLEKLINYPNEYGQNNQIRIYHIVIDRLMQILLKDLIDEIKQVEYLRNLVRGIENNFNAITAVSAVSKMLRYLSNEEDSSEEESIYQKMYTLFMHKTKKPGKRDKETSRALCISLIEDSMSAYLKKPSTFQPMFTDFLTQPYLQTPGNKHLKFAYLLSQILLKNKIEDTEEKKIFYNLVFLRILTVAPLEIMLPNNDFIGVSNYALRVVERDTEENKKFKNITGIGLSTSTK